MKEKYSLQAFVLFPEFALDQNKVAQHSYASCSPHCQARCLAMLLLSMNVYKGKNLKTKMNCHWPIYHEI